MEIGAEKWGDAVTNTWKVRTWLGTGSAEAGGVLRSWRKRTAVHGPAVVILRGARKGKRRTVELQSGAAAGGNVGGEGRSDGLRRTCEYVMGYLGRAVLVTKGQRTRLSWVHILATYGR